MDIEILADPGSVAQRGASIIADMAWEAVTARGIFVVAVSGGHTPWLMLRALTSGPMVPWPAVHIVQVDERVAPAGHTDRNLTHIYECLVDSRRLRPDQISAMPVESTDLDTAAADYAKTLQQIAGSPPVFDLAHLGLGPDGHTASLVPGDSALDVENTDVTLSGPYQGRRRMTLTYPILNRARRVLWVVTGSEKAGMVNRLIEGDRSIPAGRVRSDRALLLADCAASPGLTQTKDRLTKGGGVTCV
jgi:6-phosphogluconolactonase